jgi:hypothetical protein
MGHEPTGASAGGVIEVLGEFLVVERDGCDLYRAATDATSGELSARLFDLGVEAERRVQLLERALEQLGTPPDDAATAAGDVLRLAPVLADGRHDARQLLEALLLFEIRDELIGSTLVALARESTQSRVAKALEQAALPIESNEAWGAHDTPRHRERIEFVGDALRAAVRRAAGLDG